MLHIAHHRVVIIFQKGVNNSIPGASSLILLRMFKY
jgi:hypothetical protein